MYRIELNREYVKMQVINKAQARAIDECEVIVCDTIDEVMLLAEKICKTLRHEIVYKIVELGVLVCRQPQVDDQRFDIGGSD